MNFPGVDAEGIALVARQSRQLRRRMVAWQGAALRRARLGKHHAASERWKCLYRAHLVRQGLLRKWRLL
jgi:hypothetical protein